MTVKGGTMAQSEVRVAWEPLHGFTKEVFVRVGMPPEGAEAEAGALIWANLRGVDSHGVLRIPWYVENVDKGVMNPKPNIKVIKETPATLFIDADRALGPVVTIFVVNLVIEKARKAGIGWALIRNLTHQGALGYYSQMMAKQDMAGIVFVCNPPNMAPYGARVAGVHNSPIAISVPAKRHHPLNLDMATSVVAGGKIWLAVDKGVPIPEGWALDKDGKPTTDPKQVSALLPFGGAKGSGLALMFECLTSVMAGNPMLEPALFGKEIGPPVPDKKTKAIGERLSYVPRHIQNSVVAAIDIRTFTDVEGYKEHIDNLIDGLKALPKAEGFSEIFVPGEPEERTFDDRSRNGIPLPEGTVRNLRSIAERFGVKLPLGL
jgi:LDH2 family malate/lactate/ureidoglycolate dehydrogenase